MTNFASDNWAGASAEIVQALAIANQGPAAPYGQDEISECVEARLRDIFETDCIVYPISTGTAANSVGLSLMTPPYGAVYCQSEAHIAVDECNAPEFYCGGAKLMPLEGEAGKLTPASLQAVITGAGNIHHAQPATISITQASEWGRVYQPGEIAALGDLARSHGLGLHMDGARFGNAVVALGCSPAETTWKAGVDVLSFGATKNGAMAAEAVVVFQPELAASLAYRRKRGGHLISKMRFLSAQLDAYLDNDLWLKNARHANEMAQRLAVGLGTIAGAQRLYPVEANEIFISLPEAVIVALESAGFNFYRWPEPPSTTLRLVTSFSTRHEDVDTLVATARAAAEGSWAGPTLVAGG